MLIVLPTTNFLRQAKYFHSQPLDVSLTMDIVMNYGHRNESHHILKCLYTDIYNNQEKINDLYHQFTSLRKYPLKKKSEKCFTRFNNGY